ncbi:DinB family protein [Aquimarina sp. RZ0]|uniref:DinB family protein n=1 Tax=Aquimarina sp. RZ0 TaxID=2607730 RepID=UPI0011F3C867|nr:DinB family protein [Aquimarina sp. RZ0]KAA1245050.1 DinB family protein [Aquimarina sp. RZ0]
MKDQLILEEYNEYYGIYIAKAANADVLEGLKSGKKEFVDFVNTIPEEKLTYAYREGKWTIAEVLQHLIDSERIFSYRALCFAMNDNSLLPGFDQNLYVLNSNTRQYPKARFIEDFEAVRTSSISLFRSFTDDMLQRIGTASGSPLSARAVGYILAGHQKHHIEVIKEHYL